MAVDCTLAHCALTVATDESSEAHRITQQSNVRQDWLVEKEGQTKDERGSGSAIEEAKDKQGWCEA